MVTQEKVNRGKKSRVDGKAFENRVRADLEESGWIVDRWNNNVEFEINKKFDIIGVRHPESEKDFEIKAKLIPSKAKWNNFTKSMMMGAGGFPDFICIKTDNRGSVISFGTYEVIGVECKTNGNLDKIEQEKCDWLLRNRIFNKILIAEKTKVKNKIVIKYHDFEDKYGTRRNNKNMSA